MERKGQGPGWGWVLKVGADGFLCRPGAVPVGRELKEELKGLGCWKLMALREKSWML